MPRRSPEKSGLFFMVVPAKAPTVTQQAALCRVTVGREVRTVTMGAMTNAWQARLSRHRPHGRQRSHATQAGNRTVLAAPNTLRLQSGMGIALCATHRSCFAKRRTTADVGVDCLHIPLNAKRGNSEGVLGRWGGGLQKGAPPPISNRVKH